MFLLPEDAWECSEMTIDQVKGWTRSTVILTILLAASEMDLTDDSCVQKLLPLAPVLDKCWMLPIHVPFLHSINVLNDGFCSAIYMLNHITFICIISMFFYVYTCIYI